MDINNTEVSFLNWCGFNTDNGYYQDDINCLKNCTLKRGYYSYQEKHQIIIAIV